MNYIRYTIITRMFIIRIDDNSLQKNFSKYSYNDFLSNIFYFR